MANTKTASEVPAALRFTTPAKTTGQQSESVPFSVNGEVLTSLRPPEGALVMLMAMATEFDDDQDLEQIRRAVPEMLAFLDTVLDSPSRKRVLQMFRAGELDTVKLFGIMLDLVKYWDGQPEKAAGNGQAPRSRANGTRARASTPPKTRKR